MRLRHDSKRLDRVKEPGDFGAVAVLLGGGSSEREISLLSGKAVLAALKRRGVDAQPFDPAQRPLADLLSLKIERVNGKNYRTRDEAKADVFDYIERFYNVRRRHSTIG